MPAEEVADALAFAQSRIMRLNPVCSRPSSVPSNTSTSVSMSPPRTLAMAAVTLLIGATIARVFITISPSPVMMAMAPRTRTAMPSS